MAARQAAAAVAITSHMLGATQIESQQARSASLASEYQQATKLHERGQVEDAAKHYKRACTVGCSGELLKHLGTHVRLSQMNPTDFLSQYGLGVTYAAMGEYAEAFKLLREALRLQPDDPPTICSFGALLHRMGDLDGAIEQFRYDGQGVVGIPVFDAQCFQARDSRRPWYC